MEQQANWQPCREAPTAVHAPLNTCNFAAPLPSSSHPPSLPQSDKAAINEEASLLAFDRQNHMGASEQLAKKLRQTISEEVEVMLADKRTTAGAVNIRANAERMQVS